MPYMAGHEPWAGGFSWFHLFSVGPAFGLHSRIFCSSCVHPVLILCYSFDFVGVGFGMVSLCVRRHPNLSPRSRRVTEFLSPFRVSPGTPWHRPWFAWANQAGVACFAVQRAFCSRVIRAIHGWSL